MTAGYKQDKKCAGATFSPKMVVMSYMFTRTDDIQLVIFSSPSAISLATSRMSLYVKYSVNLFLSKDSCLGCLAGAPHKGRHPAADMVKQETPSLLKAEGAGHRSRVTLGESVRVSTCNPSLGGRSGEWILSTLLSLSPPRSTPTPSYVTSLFLTPPLRALQFVLFIVSWVWDHTRSVNYVTEQKVLKRRNTNGY